MTQNLADWSRPFGDPIVLPDGRSLVSLRDAGETVRDAGRRARRSAWQAASVLACIGHGSDGHVKAVSVNLVASNSGY